LVLSVKLFFTALNVGGLVRGLVGGAGGDAAGDAGVKALGDDPLDTSSLDSTSICHVSSI